MLDSKIQGGGSTINESHRSAGYGSPFERLVRMGSHDLKESLRMVSTYLGLLNREAREKLSEEEQGYLAYAMEGSGRLTQLIDALAKYARAAAIPIQHTHVSIESVLPPIQKKWEATAGRPIQWELNNLPTLWADVELTNDLFDRLISNAVKFTAKDKAVRISVEGAAEPGFQLLKIKDGGIGIEAEYLPTLFEPFRRIHPRKDFPGVGLGLAYCREIAELHGGRIRADSVVGEGTTIEVAFPLPS